MFPFAEIPISEPFKREFAALHALFDLLHPLDKSARERVVKHVTDMLEEISIMKRKPEVHCVVDINLRQYLPARQRIIEPQISALRAEMSRKEKLLAEIDVALSQIGPS